MSITARQLVIDALQEIKVVSATESVSSEDLAFGIRRLNRILDAWNADDQTVYADTIRSFTLVPDLVPHTIGPTGATWTMDQRPQSVLSASLIVDTTHYAINVRQAHWWMALTYPGLGTSMPTDVYYNPGWPNGELYFWPKPTTAYTVELLLSVTLGQMTANDVFWLPPGYQEAMTLTLAELLVGPMRVEMPPGLPLQAQKARARIFSVNVLTPPMITNDIGIPSNDRRGTFLWRSGTFQ